MKTCSWLSDLSDLFYPRICPACAEPLLRTEAVLCLACQASLPFAETGPGNAVEKLFYGRCRLLQADAWLLFRKQGRVQKLMHELKYRNNPGLGRWLGRRYAEDLAVRSGLLLPDLLTCIPLHPLKEKIRGYNQSAEIARGMAEVLGLPFDPDVLQRNSNGSSQTGRKRIGRWENMQGVFTATKALPAGHTGVVDDVVTTGATMEAAVLALQEHSLGGVSAFSLCIASE